ECRRTVLDALSSVDPRHGGEHLLDGEPASLDVHRPRLYWLGHRMRHACHDVLCRELVALAVELKFDLVHAPPLVDTNSTYYTTSKLLAPERANGAQLEAQTDEP